MAFESLNYIWRVSKTNQAYIEYISKIASVSPACAQILINRGLKTSEQIDCFFNPNLNRLSDPFELSGMRDAIDRITLAKKNTKDYNDIVKGSKRCTYSKSELESPSNINQQANS